MKNNLENYQMISILIGLFVCVYLFSKYAFPFIVNKLYDAIVDNSGVKPLEKIDIKARLGKDDSIILEIGKDRKLVFCFLPFYPLVRIIEINGESYDFYYYKNEDFCTFYKTNSKGIYEPFKIKLT